MLQNSRDTKVSSMDSINANARSFFNIFLSMIIIALKVKEQLPMILHLKKSLTQ